MRDDMSGIGLLDDVGGLPPEDERVRRMAAVTLGRMKAAQALPALRKYGSGPPSENTTGNAAGWALAQITGEAIPPAVVINEALELARTFSTEESVKFINGMLDGIRKKIDR